MSSSKLAVGIVGLPNVGKSTLFNALLKRQQAYVANFPFATIEPNVGVVPVPDERLEKLAEIYKSPIVPAIVEFVDIAGLIAGAHKGEGLGNKFLSHIREVDLICHVVRLFEDKEIVRTGSLPQTSYAGGQAKSDFETVKTELELADLESIEKRDRAAAKAKAGKERKIDDLPLFGKKPFLVVLNVDEEDLKNTKEIEEKYAGELGVDKDSVVAICAKTESELASLNDVDQKEYLKELGVSDSGLERLIRKAFYTLGLITFLTAGEKEVRAWTIKNGMNAQEASGAIHTDFVKNFIKADVVTCKDFIENEGWKKCRELGKMRSEGRDYVVQDGNVIEFKIGN